MKPVRPGDRGPAVEDIQRRLLGLGFDLGRTGVDGVFLGATADAVRAFQANHGLAEDGIVGDRTWSRLVDAGFAPGDRMLYLRLPHFHGEDVIVIQQALNALGFACGATDGIFGAYSERAVREFQRNAGLPADGIAGSNTFRAIMNLRHVWEGKEAQAHSEATIAPARAVEVLDRADIAVVGDDDTGRRIAERLVNLAHATSANARMHLLAEDAQPAAILRICGGGTAHAIPGQPIMHLAGDGAVALRLLTALEAVSSGHREVIVELGANHTEDELSDQRAAVLLLDAVCVAFD
jgi:peptidoglycan hydrolase-like protein with peptidoglycan-binding domain